MKGKHFVIEVQPFEACVSIVINSTMKKAIKYAKKYNSSTMRYEKSDDSAGGLFCTSRENNYFIFLKYNSTVHDIVHECFHAVMKIATSRGAHHCNKSEEFFAYSLGKFTEDVMNSFYGLKKVRKLIKVDGRKK